MSSAGTYHGTNSRVIIVMANPDGGNDVAYVLDTPTWTITADSTFGDHEYNFEFRASRISVVNTGRVRV